MAVRRKPLSASVVATLKRKAKASGVVSDTFAKEVDKQIARAVVEDDEKLADIDNEIEAKPRPIGQFSTPAIEGEEVAEE